MKSIDLLFKEFYDLENLAILILDNNLVIKECNNFFLRSYKYNKHDINNISLLKLLNDKIDPNIIKNTNKLNTQIKLKNKKKKNIELYLHNISNLKIIIIIRDIDKLNNDINNLKLFSFYDSVTNLPNRRLLYDYFKILLIQSKRMNNKIGVIYLDIDGFKNINDKHGHIAGDYILKQFANILKKSIRDSDYAARLAGDEFIILMVDIACNEDINLVIDRIIKNIKIKKNEYDIFINFSHGSSIYPDLGDNIESLIDIADKNMYKNKKNK